MPRVGLSDLENQSNFSVHGEGLVDLHDALVDAARNLCMESKLLGEYELMKT